MRWIQGGLATALFAAALASTATAQTVTIKPGYTEVGVNGTVQYTAATTGLQPEGVTWKVCGVSGGNATCGTISPGGLYTAPAAVPTVGVTISALGSDSKTMGTVYVAVEPPGPVIASIVPANPVPNGNYHLTLNGAGFVSGLRVLEGGVVISATFVNSTTINVSGWHAGTGAGTIQVQNPGTLWGAPFALTWIAAGPPPPQSIAPLSANVNLGATQQFTSAGATSFSATAGSISANGLFQAPATMPASATVTVKATGPGGTAAATVTLINPNPQIILPATVSLNIGGTQQFTSAGATAWTAKFGTIDATGFYTAPAVWPVGGTDTVGVTGPNGNASAIVTLIPPTPAVSGVGAANSLPLGLFSSTVTGSGFIAQSVAKLNGSPITTVFAGGALTISGFTSQSGMANLTVVNGSVSSAPFTVQVGVANPQVSSSAARRFLQQAAFGPTPTDADHVQTVGFQAWLNEQFAMPRVSNYNGLGSQSGLGNAFLANAVTNPDQLRQKVAFALSQIFVTSLTKVIWNTTIIPYEQMLMDDAFTNYGKILSDVTLSPAMGYFLDMANNAKANPAAGTVANENYAREIMQLFSVGTKLLNQNGTPQVGPNGQIPTYSQTDVTELARVFTGWTYTNPKGGNPVWGAYINPIAPMVPYPSQHDNGAKTLVGGYQAAQGLSPQADMAGALNNLATHPNTAPFISKQLIEHLVKSNPTPGYVNRVADVFVQTQGDMQAIVTAILLDPEARANDAGGGDQPSDGHLQEPALFLSGLVRAFGGKMTPQNYYASELANMGQDIYNAPSVFNYYSPSYVVNGTGGLLGPEFQIYNANASILRENEIAYLFGQYSNPVASYGPGTTIDLTPLLPLAATPSILVDAIDLTLTEGVMPGALKQIILAAVNADPAGSLHRVQTAIYLTLVSSYYSVWH